MKRVLLAGLFLVLAYPLMQAQMLCVGNHWTEAQGRNHLDSVLRVVTDRVQWERRAERIRQQLLTGMSLTDLDAPREKPTIRAGRVHEMDGYRVTNLEIEAEPGSWITGNLYEPVGMKGPFAGILCPHGHWSDPADYGRFRHDMQKRCIVFCRMGAVVFAYDMVGYGPNRQAPSHEDPLALRIQTRNSVRIVDYLLSRKDVDPKRIAVTGASGGGTQSFILTAVDPRVSLSIPAVQVSAHFFGGCVCESGMPIHKAPGFQTNNVEIAALAAPRPMLVISDGADWTRNTPVVEYPFLSRIYSFYGKPDRVDNAHFAGEKHDYGFSKRQAAYRFLAKHFHLKADPALWSEEGLTMLAKEEL